MSAYRAPWYLRSGTLQTMLSPLRAGIDEHHPVLASADIELLANGKRLHAFYKEHASERALVILIHGWEGHACAAYMDRTAIALYNAGFSVARLHLKDHGHTRSWNPELFNGSMLAEHYEAVRKLAGKRRVYLAGYSLGGNFALRIAARGAKKRIPGLAGVAAISAPLDPHKATAAMDNHPLIGRYLLQQWRASLREKEEHFPHLYSFKKHDSVRSVLDLTDVLVQEHSDFSSLEDYFGTYTLGPGFFGGIDVPYALLTSADDPIIPPEDYRALSPGKEAEIEITEHGGHVAFLQPRRQPYYVQFILQKIEAWESKKSMKRTVRKVRKSVHGNRKKPPALRGKHRK
jgi:predicted alpha/beta-fold hydrolase